VCEAADSTQCNSGRIFNWPQLNPHHIHIHMNPHHSGAQNHDNGGRLKLTNGFRGFLQSLSRSAQFNLSELTALLDSLPLDRHVHDQMSVSVSPLTWREKRVTTKTPPRIAGLLAQILTSGRDWGLHGCLRSFAAGAAIKYFGVTGWLTNTLLNISCWY